MSNLNHITVLGAGVLGGQIAWHSAFKGKTVVVYDITETAIEQCRAAHEQYAGIYLAAVGASEDDIALTRVRLTYTTDLAASVAEADLVIEAVPEIPSVKTSVYEEMAEYLPERTLIATNSSTLLPRDFAAATGRPDKYCALHFANLIWMMNVVEIMAHPGTSKDTLTAVVEFGIEIGMLPIAVQKEQNGYVLNTWFVALLNAAMTLVTNEVSTPEDVDRTYLISNRGAPLGPMGLIDMVGMKTTFDVLFHWGNENNDEQMLLNAGYIKEKFLDKGNLGMKTGQGFYSYPNPAYQNSDFLEVPALLTVPDLVKKIMLA
ncbi:3-hydroxyacyl-CoA dehydrogenase [Rhodococcus sp. OK302]|jgi:3-hydroxyacyl-CoA dehydrogenase|uniref:3-hydroxyacyl-CoA dehydrogenase n=1 Tax=Rhodococcus sp. OK302 TaxID=1882769 RepID=UPI000B93F857|nr:3-hydroxyacyl-CoA dehydrogenase [Rhodococcus sp. OK302]OYD60954.1 3-hydroxybutyryl-CoA dehydrogenase [Rhodococcus sp. OK302]